MDSIKFPIEIPVEIIERAVRAEYREHLKANPPDPLLTVEEIAKEMRVTEEHVRDLLGKEYEYLDEDGVRRRDIFQYENAGKRAYRARLSEVTKYLRRHQRKGRRR